MYPTSFLEVSPLVHPSMDDKNLENNSDREKPCEVVYYLHRTHISPTLFQQGRAATLLVPSVVHLPRYL